MKTRLYVEQRITPVVNRYNIFEANDSGEKGNLFSFVQQKRLNIKEKVMFYASKDKKDLKFSFRAEKVLDIRGKYFVEDATGALIGYLKKDFKKSLTRSTWYIFSADDKKLLTVTESNKSLAMLRRFVKSIPIVGDIIGIVVVFFKYHFVFLDPETNKVVGKYEKLTLFRDNYKLSLDNDTYSKVDKRVIAAMAVALDALQSR